MAQTGARGSELAQLIVEQLDDARDIFQLAEQLAPLLPIKSFDELGKAGERGRLTFRDTPFDVKTLQAYIPAIAFPVTDLRQLVERLASLVRLVPEQLGVDPSSASGMERMQRRSGLLAPGLGLITSRGMGAIVIDRDAKPTEFPAAPTAGR